MQAAGPDPWPGGCGRGSGDTMNTFTANEPAAAADLVAMARLAGDPAAAPRRARQQLTPAMMAVG
jgi:hypothetical protein